MKLVQKYRLSTIQEKRGANQRRIPVAAEPVRALPRAEKFWPAIRRTPIEAIVAFVAVLALGYDRPNELWTYPSPWGTYHSLVLSFSLLGLVLLAAWDRCTRPPAQLAPVARGSQPAAVAGTVLLASVAVSVGAALAPVLSLARLVEVGIGLVASGVIARRPALARWLLVGLASLILVELPVALFQQVTQSTFPEGTLLGAGGEIPASAPGAFVVFGATGLRWERATGTFSHPNVLGGFVALTLVLGLPWILRERRHRAFWLAVWTAGCFLIGLTFSRTAALALVGGGAVVAVATVQSTRHWKILVGPMVMALVAVFGVLAIAHDLVAGWFVPSAATLSSQSVAQRGLSVGIALDLIRMHPLIGVGAGNFTLAELLPPIDAAMVDPVHVVPLLVAAEAGPFAGLAWLFLVFVPALGGNGAEPRRSAQTIAGLGFSISLLTLGLLDHYLWSLPTGRALYWLSLGIARSGVSPGSDSEAADD